MSDRKIFGTFRLLIGIHQEKDVNGVQQVYRSGDTFDSCSDLTKLNASGMGKKFELLQRTETATMEPTVEPEDIKSTEQELNKKTITQLREIAEMNDIELGGARTKQEIIEKLLEAAGEG